MKTCNSERWSTSVVSAEFLWDYCWLAQPCSAQRGTFTETASWDNLSSLKQTIPEKRNHRPTATTAASTFSFPSPHGRGSYPSCLIADAPGFFSKCKGSVSPSLCSAFSVSPYAHWGTLLQEMALETSCSNFPLWWTWGQKGISQDAVSGVAFWNYAHMYSKFLLIWHWPVCIIHQNMQFWIISKYHNVSCNLASYVLSQHPSMRERFSVVSVAYIFCTLCKVWRGHGWTVSWLQTLKNSGKRAGSFLQSFRTSRYKQVVLTAPYCLT